MTTLGLVNVRAEVTAEDAELLRSALCAKICAELAYIDTVLSVLDRTSFRAIEAATGHSKSTLQRWQADRQRHIDPG